MGYWKTKVLPKIKKVFDKNGPKKAAAAEAIKSFDESKDDINKEFEEKKVELQPKVVEIYEASSTEIKTLVKEPKEAGLKKNSAAVNKLFEELVKIEFPGSKPVSEALSKFGASLVPGPVFFIFEKVSTFIVVTEEKKGDEEVKAKGVDEGEDKKEEAPKDQTPETSKDRDIAIEEVKKEDTAVVEEKKEADEPPPKPAAEPASEPPKKPEEPAPAADPPKP